MLKVGHNGSSSSTAPAFLKAVAPKYAVISVGAGNDYGHPHKETLAKLANAGIHVYRTDRDGTVVFTSDGKNITIEKLSSTIRPRAPDSGVLSLGNPNVQAYGLFLPRYKKAAAVLQQAY
ncbi:ComEC/Rec2 family competence protein [Desulfofundulus sp. TPOSR]|uniref:ComEC/Rec2 family competence protein n=1 Tax=Desulfofundulus sp. TPOSR TaxID=2714340 RepID=UPI0037C1425A